MQRNSTNFSRGLNFWSSEHHLSLHKRNPSPKFLYEFHKILILVLKSIRYVKHHDYIFWKASSLLALLSMEQWGCGQKRFKLVWRCHQLLSGFLATCSACHVGRSWIWWLYSILLALISLSFSPLISFLYLPFPNSHPHSSHIMLRVL